MKIVNFGKNFTTTIGGFFQYDYGQYLDVYNTGTNIENLQFEFIQDGQQITVLGEYISGTNSYKVRVPDTFLQKTSEILTYIYYEDAEKGQTIKIIIIKISAREKFESIPDPKHESIVEQILEELAHLQDEIDNWTISEEQLEEIVEEVKAEIDLNDYYDKEEVDDLLRDKADKSDTYTKNEVNNLIPDISGLASKTELNDGLALKADKSDTYTKNEVNNLIPDISGLATKQELNDGLSGKVDNATLNNYYTKTETYSKTEIDNILGNIESILEEI